MDTILYTNNILESGTLTVSGTADTGFPESRLYDRSISLYWKDTITEAKYFTVDQGVADNSPIDFLVIDKHNFSGKDLQWQWSSDNFVSDINDAVTDWTQSDNSQIIKTLDTSLTKRYWRVTISSITNPKCGEIFMSKGYSFSVSGKPSPAIKDTANVSWNKTVGGIERSTKFGDERRTRGYTLLLEPADLVNFRAVMDNLNGYAKPFYIKDIDGDYWICRLKRIPTEIPNTTNILTKVVLEVIETL